MKKIGVVLFLLFMLTTCENRYVSSEDSEDSAMLKNQEENQEILSQYFDFNYTGNETIELVQLDTYGEVVLLSKIMLPEVETNDFLKSYLTMRKNDYSKTFYWMYELRSYLKNTNQMQEYNDFVLITSEKFDFSYITGKTDVVEISDESGNDIIDLGEIINIVIVTNADENGIVTIYAIHYYIFYG